MTSCYLLDVVENLNMSNTTIASVLYGVVTVDETLRFSRGYQVITSPVCVQIANDFHTKKGSIYSTVGGEVKTLVISLSEWEVMRTRTLSPEEIMAVRTMVSGAK